MGKFAHVSFANNLVMSTERTTFPRLLELRLGTHFWTPPGWGYILPISPPIAKLGIRPLLLVKRYQQI